MLHPLHHRPDNKVTISKYRQIKTQLALESPSGFTLLHATLFGSFAQLIDALPAADILRVVDRECRMLEDDLGRFRGASADDAISIESFRFFLTAARQRKPVPFVAVLPRVQLVFYRKTLERLIEAGQLSPEARKQFVETFSVCRVPMRR